MYEIVLVGRLVVHIGTDSGLLRGLRLFFTGILDHIPRGALLYGDKEDLVFLKTFRLKIQRGVGIVDLLQGHVVGLADRVQGLALLDHV